MPNIQALIFDLDGIIADTAELHYQSWQQVADEEGVSFSREKYRRMSGTTHAENLRIFIEDIDIDAETARAWADRKQGYYAERRDTLTPADTMAGIMRLLDDAQASNLKVGVASASRNARPVLERLNLIDRFDVIGDAYSVERSKPNPDVFLWVAGALAVSPRHALVLEDALAGVQAARSAGFYVIGVGDDAPLEQAHAHIPTLADHRLIDLLALLPG